MRLPDESFSKLAQSKKTENKKFFERVKKQRPKNLDQTVQQLHEEVFSYTDCLKCANCCKTTGPLFTQRDIERLATYLRIKPVAFIEKYLRIDEDNDYVLKQVPCPFLGTDNYCSVYEYRPHACREYPHTSQRKIHTILKETYHNVTVCPAVYEIVESLKKIYESGSLK